MRTSIIFFLYRTASVAAFPFLLLYLVWRIVRERRYLSHLKERFGFWRLKNRTAPGGVWLHAVSVGEVLSSTELLRRLRDELPHTPLYVSCGTLAGREVADTKLAEIADGVFYLPFDFAFAVRGALRAVRPSVLLVLETEIWPNLYRETKRAGAAVVLVNARMSDKAAPKYQRFRWFFGPVLESVDYIFTQSLQDQHRFMEAGALAERVRIGGNLKYDFQAGAKPAPAEVVALLRRPLWIAASTTGPMRPGDVDEDDVVIETYIELQRNEANLQLLIAPRKPERFEPVAEKLRAAGLRFVRRSELQGGEEVDAILLDSVGELGSLFPYADLVFMGGTLAERGGHNILEPALCGKPVIAGPHMQNFAAIRDRFAAARGYVAIETPAELPVAMNMLLRDVGQRESLGARAKALAESERGATTRAVRLVAAYRWLFVPRAVPFGCLRPLLTMLSLAWSFGGQVKRAMVVKRSLPGRVVSIGGLAMGGVGKTPMVLYISNLLRLRGYRPAILTRGYRRKSHESVTLARGEDVPVSLTGDEAQLLLRCADVGIGADRWKVGLAMAEQFNPDVFVLDDGFQHARLERSVDIVLLDGLDPLAGDAVFPVGRLREPVTALERADILVVTRAGRRRFDGLLARLPKKPVFLADIEISGWWPDRPRVEAVSAFCGLANPQTFFESLQDAGMQVRSFHAFADHHRYTLDELRRIAQAAAAAGSHALVTTEKDAANLPSGFEQALQPLRVHTLAVRMRIRNESEFLALLDNLVGLSAHSNDGRAGR